MSLLNLSKAQMTWTKNWRQLLEIADEEEEPTTAGDCWQTESAVN